jgi:uncharacterized damage-inducible protein DinB
MNKNMSEIDRIVRSLEKTYDKFPWYGPSIIETLKDIDASITTKKVGATHSIIELVLHMTSWRTFATKRLQGDNNYEVNDDLNFPAPGSWDEALNAFRHSQAGLIEAAKKFPEERLGELVPSKTQKYTYYTLLHGIEQHDIYHAGQIMLIRRSLMQ